MTQTSVVQGSIDLIIQYGQIDGAHHKMWVLDQVLRKLAGDQYTQLVKESEGDPDDEDNYYGEWDTGIAP